MVLSASVIDAVRKEVRRASKYNPEADEVARIRRHDVIRPELLVKQRRAFSLLRGGPTLAGW